MLHDVTQAFFLISLTLNVTYFAVVKILGLMVIITQAQLLSYPLLPTFSSFHGIASEHLGIASGDVDVFLKGVSRCQIDFRTQITVHFLGCICRIKDISSGCMKTCGIVLNCHLPVA